MDELTQEKNVEIIVKMAPKVKWTEIVLTNVEMYFPKLVVPQLREGIEGKPTYSALFVLGNKDAENVKNIFKSIQTIIKRDFVITQEEVMRPANFKDLPHPLLKTQNLKRELKEGHTQLPFVGQFVVTANRAGDKQPPPVVDRAKNLMTLEDVGSLGNGTVVNVLISFGCFYKSQKVWGISGKLETIQIVKAVSGHSVDKDPVEVFSSMDSDTIGVQEINELDY